MTADHDTIRALAGVVLSAPAPGRPGADPLLLAAAALVQLALAVAVARLVRPAAVRSAGMRAVAGAAALALLCGAAAAGLAAVPDAGSAVPERPGVPVLRRVTLRDEAVPVFVTPGRPGWNLVQLGVQAVVSGGLDGVVAATQRPGTSGYFAAVRLAPGRNRLFVTQGDAVAVVALDTGPGMAGEPAAPGNGRDDGPECAAAALGAVVAGRIEAVAGCPADGLAEPDRQALLATVRYLLGRVGTAHEVAVVSDDSPRGRAALAAVRGAGVTLVAPGSQRRPLLVLSGWAAAAEAIDGVSSGRISAEGTYLAPWLLSPPLLAPSAGQLVPIRFGPRDDGPMRYVTELAAAFPGAAPTAAGFDAWQGRASVAVPRLYASALPVLPGNGLAVPGTSIHGAHSPQPGFLPGGMVVPVSGPLG